MITGIDAFISYGDGQVTVWFRRDHNPDYKSYKPFRLSIDRLSRLVGDMQWDGLASVRPFRSGFGWVAEINRPEVNNG